MMPDSSQARATVLFSGGRDSSLAACLLAQQGTNVELLSTNNGAVVATDIVEYRVRELTKRFGERILGHIVRPIFGLFRRIAIAEIERDFATYRFNLIPLGDSLASHTEAILHCHERGTARLASGFVEYESAYPEQSEAALSLIRTFVESYGISYETPVRHFQHEDEVKYALFDFGLSTKSLEGCSLFGDSYSTPDSATVQSYITAKLPACRQYLSERRLTQIKHGGA